MEIRNSDDNQGGVTEVVLEESEIRDLLDEKIQATTHNGRRILITPRSAIARPV